MSSDSFRRSATLAGLLLTLPAASGAQTTQPLPPTGPSGVDEHLRRGVEFRRAGQDEEAAREFEAAYQAAREPRTAAQLGLARQALGQWLDADRLLREALISPDDPWVARNRAALEGALAVVSRHVGALEVRGNVPGAEVLVDGVAVATLPMQEPARVLVGAVSLDVRAPGYVTASRRVVIDPDVRTRESVELRPVEAPTVTPTPTVTTPVQPAPVAPVAPRSSPSRSSPLRAWGIASFAGAGVALTLGLIGIVVREDSAVRFNSNCPPLPQSGGPLCDDLKEAETRWGTVGAVALPVASALAVTGVVLMLLPAPRRATAWRCLPTGAGVACGASF